MNDGLVHDGTVGAFHGLGASSDIGIFAERPEPERLDALTTSSHGWEVIDVRGESLSP